MKHEHKGDITVEMFEGIRDGKPLYTCLYCGKQFDEHGRLIFAPKTEVPEL
jgi:hypothetical protein